MQHFILLCLMPVLLHRAFVSHRRLVPRPSLRAQLDWRGEPEERFGDLGEEEPGEGPQPSRCKIFLGYTSNMISSGLRGAIRYLVKHSLVQCIVTTAGGIEEDFIKCLAPTYMGDFALKGAELRKKGLNRIGNLIVPNQNYCKFEDWMEPVLDRMLEEQKTKASPAGRFQLWSLSRCMTAFVCRELCGALRR